MAESQVNQTEQIVAFLLTAEGRKTKDADIAKRFKVHPGTVARARKACTGPNGGMLMVVPLASLVIDSRFQLRSLDGRDVDPDHVADLKEAYKAGKPVPPLVVVPLELDLTIVGGAHRYTAARAAGLTEVGCEIVETDEQGAYELAARTNATHGLKFGKADRRKAVETLLAKFPDMVDMSPKEFENRTGIHESTFRKIRNEIRRNGAVEEAVEGLEVAAEVLGEDEIVDREEAPERQEREVIPFVEPTPEEEDEFEAATKKASKDARKALDEAEAKRAEPEVEDSDEIKRHRQRHPILAKLPAEDIEHLMRARTFHDLDGDRLRCFVEEYLYRAAIAEPLGDLAEAHRLNKPTGRIKPVMATYVEMLGRVRSITEMSTCGSCSGKGCKECHQRGYN